MAVAEQDIIILSSDDESQSQVVRSSRKNKISLNHTMPSKNAQNVCASKVKNDCNKLSQSKYHQNSHSLSNNKNKKEFIKENKASKIQLQLPLNNCRQTVQNNSKYQANIKNKVSQQCWKNGQSNFVSNLKTYEKKKKQNTIDNTKEMDKKSTGFTPFVSKSDNSAKLRFKLPHSLVISPEYILPDDTVPFKSINNKVEKKASILDINRNSYKTNRVISQNKKNSMASSMITALQKKGISVTNVCQKLGSTDNSSVEQKSQSYFNKMKHSLKRSGVNIASVSQNSVSQSGNEGNVKTMNDFKRNGKRIAEDDESYQYKYLKLGNETSQNISSNPKRYSALKVGDNLNVTVSNTSLSKNKPTYVSQNIPQGSCTRNGKFSLNIPNITVSVNKKIPKLVSEKVLSKTSNNILVGKNMTKINVSKTAQNIASTFISRKNNVLTQSYKNSPKPDAINSLSSKKVCTIPILTLKNTTNKSSTTLRSSNSKLADDHKLLHTQSKSKEQQLDKCKKKETYVAILPSNPDLSIIPINSGDKIKTLKKFSVSVDTKPGLLQSKVSKSKNITSISRNIDVSKDRGTLLDIIALNDCKDNNKKNINELNKLEERDYSTFDNSSKPDISKTRSYTAISSVENIAVGSISNLQKHDSVYNSMSFTDSGNDNDKNTFKLSEVFKKIKYWPKPIVLVENLNLKLFPTVPPTEKKQNKNYLNNEISERSDITNTLNESISSEKSNKNINLNKSGEIDINLFKTISLSPERVCFNILDSANNMTTPNKSVNLNNHNFSVPLLSELCESKISKLQHANMPVTTLCKTFKTGVLADKSVTRFMKQNILEINVKAVLDNIILNVEEKLSKVPEILKAKDCINSLNEKISMDTSDVSGNVLKSCAYVSSPLSFEENWKKKCAIVENTYCFKNLSADIASVKSHAYFVENNSVITMPNTDMNSKKSCLKKPSVEFIGYLEDPSSLSLKLKDKCQTVVSTEAYSEQSNSKKLEHNLFVNENLNESYLPFSHGSDNTSEKKDITNNLNSYNTTSNSLLETELGNKCDKIVIYDNSSETVKDNFMNKYLFKDYTENHFIDQSVWDCVYNIIKKLESVESSLSETVHNFNEINDFKNLHLNNLSLSIGEAEKNFFLDMPPNMDLKASEFKQDNIVSGDDVEINMDKDIKILEDPRKWNLENLSFEESKQSMSDECSYISCSNAEKNSSRQNLDKQVTSPKLSLKRSRNEVSPDQNTTERSQTSKETYKKFKRNIQPLLTASNSENTTQFSSAAVGIKVISNEFAGRENKKKFLKLLEFSISLMYEESNEEKSIIKRNMIRQLNSTQPSYIESEKFSSLIDSTWSAMLTESHVFPVLSKMRTEMKNYKHKNKNSPTVSSGEGSNIVPHPDCSRNNSIELPKHEELTPASAGINTISQVLLKDYMSNESNQSSVSEMTTHNLKQTTISKTTNFSVTKNSNNESKQPAVNDTFPKQVMCLPSLEQSNISNFLKDINIKNQAVPSENSKSSISENMSDNSFSNITGIPIISEYEIEKSHTLNKNADVSHSVCVSTLNTNTALSYDKFEENDESCNKSSVLNLSTSSNGCLKKIVNESFYNNDTNEVEKSDAKLLPSDALLDPLDIKCNKSSILAVNSDTSATVPKEISDKCTLNDDPYFSKASSSINPITLDVVVSELSEAKNTPEDDRNERRIKQMEKYCAKLDKRIKKLQEKELSLDDLDDDDSVYMQEERYKKKFVQIWNQLCKLKKQSTRTGRAIEKKFSFQGSRHSCINEAIQRMINKRKIEDKFPNYPDVLQLVINVNKAEELGLSERTVEIEAANVFRDVGRKLKSRRIHDYKDLFGCYLIDGLNFDDDPAEHNEDMKKKLYESSLRMQKATAEIFDKYAEKQIEENKLSENKYPKSNEINEKLFDEVNKSSNEENEQKHFSDEEPSTIPCLTDAYSTKGASSSTKQLSDDDIVEITSCSDKSTDSFEDDKTCQNIPDTTLRNQQIPSDDDVVEVLNSDRETDPIDDDKICSDLPVQSNEKLKDLYTSKGTIIEDEVVIESDSSNELPEIEEVIKSFRNK